MEHYSLPDNERAARVKTYNLTSVITAIVCAGSIAATAVVIALVGHTTKPLRSMTQPRAYAETEMNRSVSAQLLRMCHRLAAPSSQETMVIDGIEPLFLDRFFRFQSVLFGSAAVLLTPTVASFNYRLGQQGDNLDPLDRLGWTSLSATEPELYWLYVVLALAFAVFVQVMITRELKQTLMLRSRYLKEKFSDQAITYFVAIHCLPNYRRDERGIRNICGQWQSHIRYVVWLPQRSRLDDLLNQRRRCIHAIEKLEARFIARMLRRMPAVNTIALNQELVNRYQTRGSAWTSQCLSRCQRLMPYSCQGVASLYNALVQLSREQEQETLSMTTYSATAVLALDSFHIARLLSDCEAPAENARMTMSYLGTSLSQILMPNVTPSPGYGEVRSEGVTLCTIILVILSSIPMGATGAVSQLSTAVTLLGKIDGLDMPAWVIGLIQGALPQLVTSILMSAILSLLKMLTGWRRCLSQAEAQTTIQSSYFWFLFTHLLFTTSISTGLVSIMAKMLDSGLWELPRVLAENLPLAGNYYLAYIPLHTALELATTVFHVPTLLRYCCRRSKWQPPRRVLKATQTPQSGNPLGEAYPVATTVAVIVSRVRFRYALTYVSKVSSPTNGELYLRSLFSLFWGLFVMELAFIGLFFLKIERRNLGHDVPQIMTLALLLYCTIRYREYAVKKYDIIAKGQGALISASPASLTPDTSTHRERDLVSRAQDTNNGPVDDGVIWIAQDLKGVSNALVSFVRSRYLHPFNGKEFITNAHATLDTQGQVVLNNNEKGRRGRNV